MGKTTQESLSNAAMEICKGVCGGYRSVDGHRFYMILNLISGIFRTGKDHCQQTWRGDARLVLPELLQQNWVHCECGGGAVAAMRSPELLWEGFFLLISAIASLQGGEESQGALHMPLLGFPSLLKSLKKNHNTESHLLFPNEN